jgi:hypothetical protein
MDWLFAAFMVGWPMMTGGLIFMLLVPGYAISRRGFLLTIAIVMVGLYLCLIGWPAMAQMGA